MTLLENVQKKFRIDSGEYIAFKETSRRGFRKNDGNRALRNHPVGGLMKRSPSGTRLELCIVLIVYVITIFRTSASDSDESGKSKSLKHK